MVERGVRLLAASRRRGAGPGARAAAATTTRRRGVGKPRLTVSAAASLKSAFEDYGKSFDAATARFSFAGSDELAAQIRQGVKPDVYAAANTKLPDQLFRDGLVEKPVVFAGNELVIAVPADSDIASIDDLAEDGRRRSWSAPSRCPSAPTRARCSSRLPRRRSARRSPPTSARRSPTCRASSASSPRAPPTPGFVYATDVVAAGDKLKTIELPEDLQPTVEYGAAVVKGAQRARGGAGVHRRPARRATGSRRWSGPGSCRRRMRSAVHGRPRGRAGARAGVPHAAARRDLRRRRARASCCRAWTTRRRSTRSC